MWISQRPADVVIQTRYLDRWYVTPWSRAYRDIHEEEHTGWQRFVHALPNVYLHVFSGSDYARALHDHPWDSVSIILMGGYVEHTPAGEHWRPAGSVVWRRAEDLHRIEVTPAMPLVVTLFITGRRRRLWGFDCREGWREYRDWERSGGCD